MTKMHAKLTVGACVVLGAIAYLAVAGAQQAHVYHLTVDQFLSNPDYRSERVRLCGTVIDDKHFLASPASLTANFNLKGAGVELPVQYHGVIPGLFQAGRDVIIEGQLNAQGQFIADVMMTKCASKYESQLHASTDKAADKTADKAAAPTTPVKDGGTP